MSNVTIRSQINTLEDALVKCPQVEITPIHRFADGLYVREIKIPKGTLLTGKIHKASHVNIISQGDISVLTEDGFLRIKAPYTMISLPGTKRLGYAHEDTIWTTVHASRETDIEALEKELVVNSYEELTEKDLLKIKECTCLSST